MGNTFAYSQSSTDNDGHSSGTSKEIKYLLGDLEKLNPIAQKLFNLGKICVQSVDSNSQQTNFRKLDSHISHQSDARSFGFSQSEACKEQGSVSQEFKLFYPLEQTKPVYFGQTYVRWRSFNDMQNLYAYCAPKRNIVYIQPVDNFPHFVTNFTFHFKCLTTDLFGLLQGFSQIFFSGMDVSILPKCEMEQMGWTGLVRSRNHSVTKQKQYLARDFYPLLQRILPSDGLCILGIIWTDLYPEEDMNFVFGETSIQHKSGIFCFGRFEPKGFNKDEHGDLSEISGLLVWKLIKVVSHELCHMFGLLHCTFFKCAMNESNSMAEALDQPLFLCPVCLRKLQKMCGFDVLERYCGLLEYLQELQIQLPSVYCENAIHWLEQCIHYLDSGKLM